MGSGWGYQTGAWRQKKAGGAGGGVSHAKVGGGGGGAKSVGVVLTW